MATFAATGQWSDIINRQLTEFENTPGGAPPGLVIEGILKTQATDAAMSSGKNTPQGIARLPNDSRDFQWYVDRYNREPRLTHPDDAIRAVIVGTDTRQEMGGRFTNWHGAAFGFTGAVDPEGWRPGVDDATKHDAAVWLKTYKGSMPGDAFRGISETTHEAESQNLPDGESMTDILAGVVAGLPGGPETVETVDNARNVVRTMPDLVENLIAVSGGWLESWAWQLGLGILGVVILLVGAWMVFRR